ncbi:MAG: hybrid sensor histidine kinase/response regulator [Myxococcota bacterium]
MRRVDRFGLALLAPVWALALLLSFLSLGRNAVESPVRFASAPDAEALPTVDGLRRFAIERPGEDAPRAGDRVLRIGEVDARGAGAVRATSLVWSEMAGEGAIRLTVERDGRVREVTGRTPPSIPKWPPLVVSLVFGAVGVLSLLRFPELRVAQLAFPSMLGMALYLGSHFGTTPAELLASFWLRAGALLFVQPVTVRLIRHFPNGREGARWARGWPVLLGLNGVFLADATLFGALPRPLLDHGSELLTVVAPVVCLAVGADRYRVSNRTDRRRFKWLLLGMLVASVPAPVVALASSVDPELGWWFLPGQLAQLAVPVALWIAIARHQLFDIDRMLNAAAVFVSVSLLVGYVAVSRGPAAVAGLSEQAGVTASTATALLVALALAVALPVAVFARRRLDAWTLRERRAREQGARALLAEIARADKLREIGAAVVSGVTRVWNARSAALVVEVDGVATPVARAGEATEGQELSFRIGGTGVEGAVLVGPNRSGDVYDAQDRALLELVAERVGSALLRLEQRELLKAARALNRDLSAGKSRAEQESQRKSALLATATHDLRQPLQALRLFLGTLDGRAGADEDRELIRKAQLSAIAMQQRFEALLDDTRLDAGAVRAQLQTVDLAGLFAELEGFLEPLAREKGLALEVAAGGLAVRSDPALLRSILQNLLTNALRYTDAGTVRVAAVEKPDGVGIEVRDSGRGMDEEELRRMFEAGARGRSADGDAQGSGLGLSIVSRLCDLLGHAVEVRSRAGQGTTVTVRAGSARVGVASSDAPGDGAASGARVVVIDDDPETREGIEALLRSWGVEVASGASAQDLLAASPGFAPDAALLDYRLADGTGLEALDALEAAWGPLAAAVLTGETDPAVAERVRRRGLPLLRKPAAPVQIRAVLTSLLGR